MTEYELSLVGFTPEETIFNQKSCDLLNVCLVELLKNEKPLSGEWYYTAKKIHDYVADRKWRAIDEARAKRILVFNLMGE